MPTDIFGVWWHYYGGIACFSNHKFPLDNLALIFDDILGGEIIFNLTLLERGDEGLKAFTNLYQTGITFCVGIIAPKGGIGLNYGNAILLTPLTQQIGESGKIIVQHLIVAPPR